MKNFIERLTKSQQYALMGGAVIVVILILIQFLVYPLHDARSRAQRALKANQRILKEIIPLGAEYRNLRQRIVQVEGILAARPKDFNLFPYVEKKAVEAEIKKHIKYINPVKTTFTGPYEEAVVDVALEALTIKQLVSFIYLIESPIELVKIKNISITKSKEKPAYLTATMQVVTYVLPQGEALGNGAIMK